MLLPQEATHCGTRTGPINLLPPTRLFSTSDITPTTHAPKPTFWQHLPGQPNAAPPKGAEWTDCVFVKGKGWTHERDLIPGDQLRMKDGSWNTVKPDQVIETTDEHPFFVKGKG